MVTKAKDFSRERFWCSEDLYKSRFLRIKALQSTAFAIKGFYNERLGQMDGPSEGQDQSLPRAISQQLPYHLA